MKYALVVERRSKRNEILAKGQHGITEFHRDSDSDAIAEADRLFAEFRQSLDEDLIIAAVLWSGRVVKDYPPAERTNGLKF